MKNQRGVALSGLLFWSVVLVLVAVLGMKVLPTYIEYTKILKDAKGAVSKAGPDSTVTDVRRSFDKFAEIDMLDFPSSQLDVSKDGGRIVIEFAYEKRIPLFWNVSLLIDYKGSTAG
ncbi:MAG: putative transrane protein [Proteobacteria bacterium]|nr:putative transrane protein [Pseudomonadota bacterium]